jgi:ectoine hydroxylase-related dioxygenase (phytanoyl-CoA dioxygenase family)
MSTHPKYVQLIEEGYCTLEAIYSQELIGRVRAVTDELIDRMTEEEIRQQRSTGSMISVMQHEGLVDLIADEGALEALASMGLRRMRFQSGYVISKPPRGPQLFWHFDWGGWSHPISFEKIPVQLFLMIYLTDTSRENGCLRVIPGSHLHENPLHAELALAHSDELAAARDLSRVEYQPRPDEVDVCVRAGDLVVGDSRILHAAHANRTDHRRTVVTLWFHPFADDLPASIRAYSIKRIDPIPDEWSEASRRRVRDLLITCDAGTEAVPFSREYLRKNRP